MNKLKLKLLSLKLKLKTLRLLREAGKLEKKLKGKKIIIFLLFLFMSYPLSEWRKLGRTGQERLKAKVVIEYFEEQPDCGQAEIFTEIRGSEVNFFIECLKREI